MTHHKETQLNSIGKPNPNPIKLKPKIYLPMAVFSSFCFRGGIQIDIAMQNIILTFWWM